MELPDTIMYRQIQISPYKGKFIISFVSNLTDYRYYACEGWRTKLLEESMYLSNAKLFNTKAEALEEINLLETK